MTEERFRYVDRCAECGGRIHRNGPGEPWKHGSPKDHAPRPRAMTEERFRPIVTLSDGRRVEFVSAEWADDVADIRDVDSVAVIVTVMVDGGIERVPIRLTHQQIIEGLGP